MMNACGIDSPEALFEHLPEAARLARPLDLPAGISEYEIVEYFRQRAAENANGYASFLGAGVYNHFRPVLVDAVASRGEFLTSYTPYQAEISQGTLTAIFEFQTMICQLTGMDVANASMYDGSTAVPEAVMMAARLTGKGRALIARSVHPEYRETLRTYAKHQGVPVEEFGYSPEAGTIDLEDLDRKMDDLTAAVVVQSPNFFGIVDQVQAAGEIAHRRGALLILVFTKPFRWGFWSLRRSQISWPANCNPSRFRPATAARSRASLPPGRSTYGRCRAGWWGKPPIRAATARSA